MSDESNIRQSETAPPEGDIGLTSGQLMLTLQLGIFLPILGPLLMIAIGAMNRKTRDGRLIMLGGAGLIALQLLTLSLVWGYIASRPISGPMT